MWAHYGTVEPACASKLHAESKNRNINCVTFRFHFEVARFLALSLSQKSTGGHVDSLTLQTRFCRTHSICGPPNYGKTLELEESKKMKRNKARTNAFSRLQWHIRINLKTTRNDSLIACSGKNETENNNNHFQLNEFFLFLLINRCHLSKLCCFRLVAATHYMIWHLRPNTCSNNNYSMEHMSAWFVMFMFMHFLTPNK